MLSSTLKKYVTATTPRSTKTIHHQTATSWITTTTTTSVGVGGVSNQSVTQSIRYNTTNQTNKINPNTDPNTNTNTKFQHPQPFVKIRLTPGEWDPSAHRINATKPHNRRKKPDPLHRPPWKIDRYTPKIISAEDFAARPRVSFHTEFKSLHDGMIVLSHMGERDREDIYDLYLSMMAEQERAFQGSVTSHEYVVKVIAQRYNVTPSRIAGVIQNCHDREQIVANGGTVHTKLQEFVDAKVQEHIERVYAVERQPAPTKMIENPVASYGEEPSSKQGRDKNVVMSVDDLYDVNDLLAKAVVREKEQAQLAVDGRIYVEDVNEMEITASMNSECQKLIEKKKEEEFVEFNGDFDSVYPGMGRLPVEPKSADDGSSSGGDDEDGDKVVYREKRPRWKFAAKIINVREQRMTGRRSRRGGKNSKNDLHDNTLIEQDGVLRAASIGEVNRTPWKAERDELEFIMKGVKEAWMDRKNNGTTNGWGRIPRPKIVKEVVEEKIVVEEASDDAAATSSDDGSDDNKTE